ncbi:MAG: site-specific DNA-methyltransferase [Vicinamibacterales bacterium]
MALRTEADVVRTLTSGTYTLEQIYALVGQRGDVARDGGMDPVHPGDRRWWRRVRGALQQLRAGGQGRRVGKAMWAIDGTPQTPKRMTLIVAGGTLAEFELRLRDAIALLREVDEPVDLVVTDPPYGLRHDKGAGADLAQRVYSQRRQVVGGYVDVDPAAYDEFTYRWVAAAAAALRDGGQLVVVTGPEQAAIHQVAATAAGLTFVSAIAARRAFALRSTRRRAMAHWTVTTMCRGRRDSPKRVFNTPPDLPKAASGLDYPLDYALDWWEHNGRVERTKHGLLTYDNMLPERFAWRLVYAHSRPGDLVVDPFCGAGSIPEQAHKLQRRVIAGDVNAQAIAFTAARMLDEALWPGDRAPTLTAPPAVEQGSLFADVA